MFALFVVLVALPVAVTSLQRQYCNSKVVAVLFSVFERVLPLLVSRAQELLCNTTSSSSSSKLAAVLLYRTVVIRGVCPLLFGAQFLRMLACGGNPFSSVSFSCTTRWLDLILEP